MIQARKKVDGVKERIFLALVQKSENPSLDSLSFVLESVSEDKKECDLAPAFKNLTEECKGKRLDWRRSSGS